MRGVLEEGRKRGPEKKEKRNDRKRRARYSKQNIMKKSIMHTRVASTSATNINICAFFLTLRLRAKEDWIGNYHRHILVELCRQINN